VARVTVSITVKLRKEVGHDTFRIKTGTCELNRSYIISTYKDASGSTSFVIINVRRFAIINPQTKIYTFASMNRIWNVILHL
jgi:hypothetical protein